MADLKLKSTRLRLCAVLFWGCIGFYVCYFYMNNRAEEATCTVTTPVVLMSYNNPTLLDLSVQQLRDCFDATIIIMDNGSTYPPMLEYLKRVQADKKVTVWKLGANYGPRVLFEGPGRKYIKLLPRYFAVSDSDLRYNNFMPKNFLCVLISAMRRLRYAKVGLALDIADHDQMFDMPNYYVNKSIYEWEKTLYQHRLDIPGWPELSAILFRADIDTTFAVYDKLKIGLNMNTNDSAFVFTAARIGGVFAAKHRPWYPKMYDTIPDDEIRAMYGQSSGTMAKLMQNYGIDALRKRPSISNVDMLQDSDLSNYVCGGRNHAMYTPYQPE